MNTMLRFAVLVVMTLSCHAVLIHRSPVLHKILSRQNTALADFSLPAAITVDRALQEVEQYHGTTTLAFVNGENIIICVDSKASMGNFVGSRTVNKILPITDTAVATMAGGAADCLHWIREVSRTAKVMEFDNGGRLRTVMLARMLSSKLREYRGKGLSVGTMVAGIDPSGPSLYYVDSDGTCAQGSLFCVGSGSSLAYSVLDAENAKNIQGSNDSKDDEDLLIGMSLDQAVNTAVRAVKHATVRDGYSGGMIQVAQLSNQGLTILRRLDCRSMNLEK